LVVAASAGANLATEFDTSDFDEAALKSGVHIFIRGLGNKAALLNPVTKFEQTAV
jgi:hypothetical protein